MDWAANGVRLFQEACHAFTVAVTKYLLLGERPLLHTDKRTVVIRIEATPCERVSLRHSTTTMPFTPTIRFNLQDVPPANTRWRGSRLLHVFGLAMEGPVWLGFAHQ